MVSRANKNKGGRGRKASKKLRLQGVWNYSDVENNISNERAKAVINFYTAHSGNYPTMKDFIEEALLFWREKITEGKYRPAHVAVTSEIMEAVTRLNNVAKRLENLDFSELRAVVPTEHQHHITSIERQIFDIRGDTNVMIGSATSFDIEDEPEW